MNTLLHVSFYPKSRFDYENTSFENVSLFSVVSGEFTFCAPGGARLTIGSNSAVLFPKGIVVEKKVIKPLRMHLITYENIDESSALFKKAIFSPVPLRLRAWEDMARLDRDYFGYKLKLEEYEELLCRDLYYEIISEAAGYDADSQKGVSAEEIREYFLSKLSEPLYISKAADHFGYSYTGFLKLFKKLFSVSPERYVEKLRMENAAVLLTSTDMPVKEAAKRCGYDNEFYFSSRFCLYYGEPPSVFRKNVRGV